MAANRFYPRFAYVNDISNAQEAVIGFTDDHDFIVGENVSLRVRKEFGMFQINNKNGKVLSATDTTITVDIDTTTWDPFDYSALNTEGSSPPVCVPTSSGVINSNGVRTVVIDDAFDNRRT